MLRRFAIANVNYIFQSPIDVIPRTPAPHGYTILPCSAELLRQLVSNLDFQISERDFERLNTGEAKCFVALHADLLAGFAWVAFGNIPGEMNHDGKPETGLPIRLADDSAFIFQVLVLPAHRGRRIYAAILSQLADQLQSNGIRMLVLTTEGSNRDALLAVERMEFRRVGQTSLFRVGPLVRVTYPTLPSDIGFTIERYVGDTASHDE